MNQGEDSLSKDRYLTSETNLATLWWKLWIVQMFSNARNVTGLTSLAAKLKEPGEMACSW